MRPTRRLFVGVVSIMSAVAAPAVRADVPDIPDAAFKEACDDARAVDACPKCSCEMITSTSSHPAAAASTVPLGVVLELKHEDAETGVTYSAVHAAIGSREKLDHVGRLAEGRTGGPGASTYEVVAQQQVNQTCVDNACDFEPMGLIHPFVVTSSEDGVALEGEGTFHSERTVLALCFEGPGANTCTALPIAQSERTEPFATEASKKKKATRTEYKRTWKLGKVGEVAFGAAKGPLAKRLKEPKAFKIQVFELGGQPDAVQLVRYPSE